MELSRYLDLLTETVWPIDCGPGTDVPRRDDVGRPSVPARLTTKPVPRRPVLPRTMPALRTGLARVRGIDGNHGNPSQQRLVLDECALLMKGPAVQSCSLSAAGRYPVTDSLEVFQAMPRPVRCAFCTSALLIRWLTSRLKRASLPEICRSFLVAAFVLFLWRLRRRWAYRRLTSSTPSPE